MKLQSNTLFPLLSKAHVKGLTTIVNETLDVNFSSKEQAKNLSVADLWMIHKQKRSFSTRRFI